MAPTMIFGANLGFHQRESNSRQNCRGNSMELDFEARSATFEETLDALTWIFPASSEKINQKFKQCLKHLYFRACFCAKRAKLGWCSSFCPSFKVANFLRNKEGGKGGHVHKRQPSPTIAHLCTPTCRAPPMIDDVRARHVHVGRN